MQKRPIILRGSFAKETYNFKESTHHSHPIDPPQDSGVLQYVARCGSMLQLVCCNVLQRERQQIDYVRRKPWVCRSVLQCVAVCCIVLQCVGVCCSVLHRDWRQIDYVCRKPQLCCSVLQCAAVCCNLL